jgi:PTS system sucrose-specific IIC component
MDNKQLALVIVEKAGGKDNIADLANCMTRMRMHVKHPEQISKTELEAIEGVLGVILEEDYLQVVLGPGKAKKVTDEALAQLGLGADSDWKANKEAVKSKQKKSKVKDFLAMISGIFVPLIPAIIAAGLFNGFASLISQLIADGNISGDFWTLTQLIFSLIGSGFLSYFAIYTGIQAAKVFGATPAMGGMIGAVSIGGNIVTISTMLGLYNEAVPLNSVLTTSKGGIIGVIFGVWILSVVEKKLRKIVPDVLDLIITPFVSLLVTSLLFIFLVMPAAGFVSDWLVGALSLLINSSNPVVSVISGFVLAALFLPMVLLGLHHGLIPIYAIQLETLGGVSLFPVLAMGGAGQVGAAIAIYFMAKKVGNEKLQAVIAGALPAGFLGVGEPLIYGVTLPLGKPFVTAGLGAGFGGAYVMLMHVMSSAWGPSGLVAIPLMIGTSGMLNYFIGLVIAYIAGFVITRVMIRPKDVKAAE